MQADLGKNYFELFGLPACFDIDAAGLASRYLELQRRFHPDRFASGPESERRRSMQMTAQINAAYQTLRDTVARGRYLLALQGVNTDEETDTRMSPAFLMEQMELREELDAVRGSPERTARLDALRRQVEGLIETKAQALGQQFAENSDAGLQQARTTVREMQFLQKLSSEIEALE
jgi:molecular chaperone HscB